MTSWADVYNEYRNWLTSQGIIFSFTGYLSEDMLTTLGSALKKRMALSETDANVAKRVFSVFVEQVQNIIRYSADRVTSTTLSGEMSGGMVTVGFSDGRFFVVCGNIVAADRAEPLRQRLMHLASLDKDQLKAYYREKLREPAEEDSHGGSIGLIEIARRSSEPIDFDIVWLEPDKCRAFFCIKAYI